ncbi:MAG TPA: ABC transporter permease [Vicinamibacterales bacterium]|nr:ABC transporter permease [Vicinamibacterales bacterium]
MTTAEIRRLIRDRVAAARLAPEAEASVVDELVQHVEDRRRDLIARGLPEAVALAKSLLEIEGHERLARDLRQVMPHQHTPSPEPAPRWWSGAWADLRYAARTLRRSPGFALAAIVTVALSTGPTMAALGIANAMFWRPVPAAPEPDRLGVVWFGRWVDGESFSPWRVSYGHVAEMSKTFTTIAAIAGTSSDRVNLVAPELPARLVDAEAVNANYFDVLGVPLAAGRGFQVDEDRAPGGALVTIVSHELAQTLGRDRAVVGRTVIVNGSELTVIGVAAPGFRGTVTGRRADLWFTGMTSARLNHFPADRWAYQPNRGPFYAFVFRLAPGASFDQAQAELTGAARGLAAAKAPGAEIFESRGPTVFHGLGVEPLARGETWRTVQLLLMVGALLAALGAANLGNLFIFRTVARTQEAAVRRALGASAARLARLLVTESILISSLGALLGLALTLLSRSALSTAPLTGIRPLELAIDWRLVALATLLASTIGVLLGLAPARIAARASLSSAMAQRTRGTSRSGSRLRVGLAVAQLALSLMLCAGAVLFVQTLQNLRGVDLGFVPDGVATLSFSFRTQGYDDARTKQFLHELLDRVAASPGIEAAAVAQDVPMVGGGLVVQARRPDQDATTESTEAAVVDVTAWYFRTLGIPIIAGRAFTDDESFVSKPEPRVIVNRSLARRLFGTDNAVGRTLIVPAALGNGPQEVAIIGVAGDVHWQSANAPPDMRIFRPYGVSPAVLGGVLTVKASRAADGLRVARSEASRIDAHLPVAQERSLRAIVDGTLAQPRLFAWVLGVLAGLGFLLAAVGVHGLVSQVVAERTREFGIRLALGATPRDVVGLVIRNGALVIALGVPMGVAATALSSRLVASQLFGVGALNPVVYGSAAAALVGVVIAASLGPAIRASRGNPVDVLRTE